MIRTLTFATLACIAWQCAPAQTPAQTNAGFGGTAGADASIEAIEPTDEALSVGLAGDDPADIARYILAAGALTANISPDGEAVAWLSLVTGVPQVWTVSADGGAPRQLTFGNGVDFFRWLPDSAALLYGADNDGNEQPAYFLISADGSQERLVLPAARGGFRRFGEFRADGRSFVYASTERNGLDFDIYEATLDGTTRLIYEGSFAYFAHSVAPDGSKVVVTESVGEDADNLYLLDVASGRLETVSRPEPRANHSDGGFAWEPDGSAFLLASNVDREFAALMRYAPAAAALDVVEATPRDTHNVSLCGPDGRYLAWTENHDGFGHLFVRDRRTAALLAAPPLPEGVLTLSCAREQARLAIHIDGWRTPGTVVLWDLEHDLVRTVVEANLAGLDAGRLVRPESIRMRARDGIELQGLLYSPDAASRTDDGPPPVLFIVHGGPTSQSAATFDPVSQYHADRGVAVFKPNVRGSTGFGRTFVTLDDREHRPDSVRDLIDMLDALGQEGLVDTSRAVVAGGSYGGYMVNAVLSAYPGRFSAGVAMYGVGDWVAALEVASPALKASDRIEYGDIAESRWRRFYREISPVAQADRIDVPVLYSHGVVDPRVDISETETMVRTLRANGVPATFIRFPDEGHGWRRLSNRLFYYRRQAGFVDSVLGIAK